MNILDGYGFKREDLNGINNTVLTYHRIIEAFKYAYAKRTELGDTEFININEVSIAQLSYIVTLKRILTKTYTVELPSHYSKNE